MSEAANCTTWVRWGLNLEIVKCSATTGQHDKSSWMKNNGETKLDRQEQRKNKISIQAPVQSPMIYKEYDQPIKILYLDNAQLVCMSEGNKQGSSTLIRA